MATCPKGHESTATDYCDECGAPMGGAPMGAAVGGAVVGQQLTPATTNDQPCPDCGSARTGRFCEVCGHDFEAVGGEAPSGEAGPAVPVPAPSGESGPAAGTPSREGGAPSIWRVVVTADREYYDRMRAAAEAGAEEVPFPAFCPERRFALTPPQMLIGRQSRSRGIEPDIDLTGPPADPAVSHSHAILVAQPDGGWAVVDLGSANGTYVNGSGTPIAENIPVPLADGDRVHVGAWSTLTLRTN
jgi:hypothetical protein